MVRRGVIPCARFGKAWRIPSTALEGLMRGEGDA
jgi:hypothetical protein